MTLLFDYIFNISFFFSFVALVVIIVLVQHIISSVRFKRSFASSLIETYLHYTSKRKKHAKSPKKFEKYLKRHKERSDEFIFPKVKLKCDIEKFIVDGVPVYKLSNNPSPKANILFLHGGAFISQPLKYHWKFCDKMVKDTNANIIFPIYPLTPNHHWDESFNLVDKLYAYLNENCDLPLFLMGDSSGGGLALSYCEYLSLKNLKQPEHLFLFSPWLDTSMSHPLIKKYEKIDPMLSIEPTKVIARLWANGLELSDYHVSPFYGDVTNLKNITIFTGTRELLYPEITDFYNRLKDSNIDCELIVGNGMNHDYILYPIPEATKARKYVSKIINKIGSISKRRECVGTEQF